MGAADIKTIVIDAMAGTLTPLGYRRTGFVFRRVLGQLVHLVQLQGSRSSSAEVAKLTVNLAVFVPSLSPPGKDPAVIAAQWRSRIGGLMPEKNDRWWTISSERQAVAAASEISDALANHGIPALSKVSSLESLRQLWASGISPGLTAGQRARVLAQLNAQLGR
jgi:hypothetical protein